VTAILAPFLTAIDTYEPPLFANSVGNSARC